ISGLHLGIIYYILLLLTKPLRGKNLVVLRLILILAGLWTFSFLAGAQPSVLRSAVMFSALAWSTVIHRRSAAYNTLALSAFLLLWYNPYWLWDVGFQLSYLAVLSILIFYRPLYAFHYFPNKGVNFLWKGIAATLAAQLLTLPVSIYHFNQFPLLFFVANVFAVPLSSLILIGEIVLCTLSFLHPIASVLGWLLEWLIAVMNAAVEHLNTIRFAVWKGLSVSLLQMALLYVVIAAAGCWLLEKTRMALNIALAASLLFLSLRTLSFLAAAEQQTILVYNVPKYDAIDFIAGRNNYFLGDPVFEWNEALRNFHLQPSRTMLRVTQATLLTGNTLSFGGKTVLIVDTTFRPPAQDIKPVIDLLILCRNPSIYLNRLTKTFAIRQIVISGSVPAWKAKLWQKDADSLHIPCFDVGEKGAFAMNIHTPTFAPLRQAFKNSASVSSQQ
ncbi:MAG: ComEC/Rec2 family competence protein, partial [Chitinophagaceae bacterium]